MQHIIVFEQQNFMMARMTKILSTLPCKVHTALNFLQLEYFLNHELAHVDMIIAELNFRSSQEIEMIAHYLQFYPDTTLIIFTTDHSRKAFLDSITVGASDYIIDDIPDEDIRIRIRQHLYENATSLIPTHLLLNLNKYLSGELIKANKGHYELTIAFTSITNEIGEHVSKEYTASVANYLSSHYWDTDSLVIYGYNHMLSFFPFCSKNTIQVLEKKLQSLFNSYKLNHHMVNHYKMHTTYVTFPEEGLTVEDILKIVRRKIEKSTLPL